nr:putative lipid II flippase FtsW [Buchnera aphidicola]
MVFWKKNSSAILMIAIFFLFLVLLIGNPKNGSCRWINLGLFHMQPSELCKISSFLYVSSYLSRKINQVSNSFWSFLKPICIIVLESILLLLEPDLGTVIVLIFTVLSVLFLSGVKIVQFISIILIGICTLILLIMMNPYRIKRITSFWHPWEDPFGNGYQLTQSLIALGRGHFFGQGLGNSIQKLHYLPEAHSDFIFSIIGEELGYAGSFFVLLMIFLISFRAIHIGKNAIKKKQVFSGFLAFSIGIWFSFQTFINVGAATGLLPTKGLTFPLVSYGGSSLIINLISIFFLLRIDFETKIRASQAFSKGDR